MSGRNVPNAGHLWARMNALELAGRELENREFSAVDFRSRLGYSSEVLTYQ